MSELKPYTPSWRDRIASALMGDNPSQERRNFVGGLMGSTGLGTQGAGLVDFVPGGQVFGAQEAAQKGDYQGAAFAMMPVPGARAAKGAVTDEASRVARALIEGQGMSAPKETIRAYHAAYEPFDAYDFSRLGQVTGENVGGTSAEDYAMNLARLGAWASDKSVAKQMAAPVTLPVEISGKAKEFPSLSELEAAIQNAGGPDALREDLLSRGFGHVAVNDEEFGGRSFIGLSPDYFRIVKE